MGSRRLGKTVTEIEDDVETSVANVSQHLRVMRDSGSVRTRKVGKSIYIMRTRNFSKAPD